MQCVKCGGVGIGDGKLCGSCGAELVGSGDEVAGVAVANDAVGMKEFYKAVIGQKNQEYYLDRFETFDAQGKPGIGWHWPAFFITFYWFLYRKMWLHALGYLVVPSFLMGALVFASVLVGEAVGEIVALAMIGIGYMAYTALIFAWFPMYANTMYYNHCRKKIARARDSSPDVQRQLDELSKRGGTSIVAIVVLLVISLVGIVAMVAGIVIAAKSQSAGDAQPVEAVQMGNGQARQAMEIGLEAADKVVAYYEANGEVPASLVQAGYTSPLPEGVREISIDEEANITVTLGTGPLEGKSLVLVPSVKEDGNVEWQCESGGIGQSDLPAGCVARE